MTSPENSVKQEDTPILIVDDSAQYSEVLKRMLQGAFGYRDITSVSTTAEALKLLTAQPHHFRLLFVDYNFPQGDNGINLLHRLKDAALLNDKVALLITSEPTVERLKEAVSYGALGIVAKPFETAELKKQLEKADRLLKTAGMDGF